MALAPSGRAYNCAVLVNYREYLLLIIHIHVDNVFPNLQSRASMASYITDGISDGGIPYRQWGSLWEQLV